MIWIEDKKWKCEGVRPLKAVKSNSSSAEWKVGQRVEWFVSFTARDSEDKSKEQYHIRSEKMDLVIMDPGNNNSWGGIHGHNKPKLKESGYGYEKHHHKMNVEIILTIVFIMFGGALIWGLWSVW